MSLFSKILIANRGEIALRIQRACKDLGIPSVQIHSTADSESMAVRTANESICVGGPRSNESYLNAMSILSAALVTRADALHPGIGFLSENADFAQMVMDHGLGWIGPSPAVIRKMGDKVEAKRTAKAIGLPLVPGYVGAVESADHALKIAADVGYPVLLKAASGGGGRGMRVVARPEDLPGELSQCIAEARAAFGDDTVYLEKYLGTPRHIEFQIIADQQGRVLVLGERDCSVQRRHQKVIEEAPSVAVSPEARRRISAVLEKAMGELGYVGVGTVEFLYENDAFYFIEMNTRLQVEHPVTELIYGLDLVTEQIRVASGEPIVFGPSAPRPGPDKNRGQDSAKGSGKAAHKASAGGGARPDPEPREMVARGHAIECRINAEDPLTFLPSPGRINRIHLPGGMGVRVDSALYDGAEIPPWYDGLAAKVITWGRDREEARRRMLRALSELVIDGVKTNTSLHLELLRDPTFMDGSYDIHWLETRLARNKAKDEV